MHGLKTRATQKLKTRSQMATLDHTTMNETTRTLTFVGVAAVLAAAAFGMHAANQPPSLEEFSDVGEEFYADFNNPREATGLRVAAYNDEAARVDAFNVEFKNGLWRIP